MKQQVDSLMLIMPFVLITAVFYIFTIVPEKKKKKQYADMLERLKINDEVITKGGIMGRITNIQETFIMLESGSDNVSFKLNKNGIASVISVSENNK